jgi:hypothetical protein
LKYCYVYTGDRKKEERLKRIDEAIEFVKSLNEEVIFAVNDLQSIAYIKEKGYKALNLDALADLFNLLTPEDSVILCTPEDTAIVKASFRDVKEICNG